MAPSTLLSSATTRPAAKAPSALPLAGLAAAAAAAFLAARVLPGDEDDTNEVRERESRSMSSTKEREGEALCHALAEHRSRKKTGAWSLSAKAPE
jgi:hypothetical protein